MNKKNLVVILLTGMISVTGLKAQDVAGQAMKDSIGAYLTAVIGSQTYIRSIQTDSVKVAKKKIQLFAGEALSYGHFDRRMVDSIYAQVRTWLPGEWKKYDLEIISDSYKIEDYVALRRKERFVNKVDVPLKTNISHPAKITQGLQNRHIAMWQSHGWYYEQKLARWEWQRARIFQTVEDLYTQSYVLPYLAPMLENAGANVFLPRERDTQQHEIIVDNDRSSFRSAYTETSGKEAWTNGEGNGFGHFKDFYVDGENPFRQGAYRQVKTVSKGEESLCQWIPDIPEKGKYAVYISYETVKNSTQDAHYTVFHNGGKTGFSINQQMGGGTWIFLGFFSFDKGTNDHCKIVLTNKSQKNGRIITADAVKIGGGMGNIARTVPPAPDTAAVLRFPVAYKLETSGRPRYTEGARYWLQWAGMPDSIYRWSKGERDYTDDYQSRGLWVNHIAGGSSVLPGKDGLHIPLDMAFAFHTDAGTTFNDSIIGTLGICMTHFHDELFANGKPRILSRDLTSSIMDEVVRDIRTLYEPDWTRRAIWNRSYSEARLPEVPTMLLELLSHQNFADMRYGLDPGFQFSVCRSIYKGILKFLAFQYNYDYVVAPLPVKSVSARFAGETSVNLTWETVDDPLEPTATAQSYIVYTRRGDGDFDNGIVADKGVETTLPIEKDVIYSFKITAINEGGESFPSEILSVCRKSNEKGIVLVVNGFDRISAPDNFSTTDSIAGFLDRKDHGVPDKSQYNFIGSQYEFRRNIPWMDDDAAGFGASNADYETTVIAGNTFDYPFVHGKSIVQAGYSFVSANSAAVMNGQTNLNEYRLTDLILGKQKQVRMGRGVFAPRFKTFPDSLQAKIAAYCHQGGNIFISGAYVGTDLWDTDWVKQEDIHFVQDILRYRWRTGQASVTGQVKSVASPFSRLNGR
ncbi:MAG: xanthan lyase, partial [Tannerella sp.]|nr:xanthan lyase [Tannerella sp.]